MSLKRCERGHFYNGSKFRECPKCLAAGNAQQEDPSTMPMGMSPGTAGWGGQEDSVTVAMPAAAQQEDSVTVPYTENPGAAPYAGNPAGQPGAAPYAGSPAGAAPYAGNPAGQPGAAPYAGDSVTVPYSEGGPAGTPGNSPLQDAVNKAITGEDDDGKTVSFYKSKKGIDPVAGWLVCVEGEDFGASFTIKTGRNFIGRSSAMDVVLHGDNSISRERHAIVLYEPKRREFIAQAGESRELFYLNDEVVLNPVRLKQYDILTIGNTRLMFFPCCGENFSWDDLDQDEK